MPPFSQEPWSDIEKLVIGIDIGTTQTAVSYVHLYPGTCAVGSLTSGPEMC
jgi:molecular chaperone DnaK (HSP70)